MEKIRFDGALSFQDGVSRFSVAGSFRTADFSELTLEILWHGTIRERQRGITAFMANKANHIWIPNEHPHMGHLEILGLRGFASTFEGPNPVSSKPEFSAIQIGIHKDIETEDRKFHLNVRLTPSGLFSNGIHEQHYTGEIKITKLDWPAILLKTQFGELNVHETFEYEKIVEFGNKVTKRIPKSTISGEIVVPKGSSLYDANEKIKEELERIRIALSLCYRQRVQFVSLSYRDANEPQIPLAYYRKKTFETEGKRSGDDFIETRNLGNGGLQKIVDAIRANQSESDLVRAVDFLASSYSATLENAFFMAFSAMETIVNISIEPVNGAGYTSAQWKVIKKSLENAICAVAAELSINSADLIDKLPELKRLSFKKRVTLACETLHPEVSDIWPNRDFIQGISEAAGVRNGLFHSAKYSDGAAIAESLIRVRTFTERLIAKLLGWPDSDLWIWRDQDLKFLNRG